MIVAVFGESPLIQNRYVAASFAALESTWLDFAWEHDFRDKSMQEMRDILASANIFLFFDVPTDRRVVAALGLAQCHAPKRTILCGQFDDYGLILGSTGEHYKGSFIDEIAQENLIRLDVSDLWQTIKHLHVCFCDNEGFCETCKARPICLEVLYGGVKRRAAMNAERAAEDAQFDALPPEADELVASGEGG